SAPPLTTRSLSLMGSPGWYRRLGDSTLADMSLILHTTSGTAAGLRRVARRRPAVVRLPGRFLSPCSSGRGRWPGLVADAEAGLQALVEEDYHRFWHKRVADVPQLMSDGVAPAGVRITERVGSLARCRARKDCARGPRPANRVCADTAGAWS